MSDVERWITKNGRRIPIRKRGSGQAAALVAAGVFGLSAVGAGGVAELTSLMDTTGSASSAGSPGSAASRAGGKNLNARKADSRKAAREGRADEAWQRLGMRRIKKTAQQDVECLSASFDEVQRFFLRTPCTSLDRVLYAIGDDAGNTVVVSVAWVGFRNSRQARDFKEVIDVHGTGDIKPLGSGLLGLADIHFTGHHYDSKANRSVLTVAEAESATGRVDPALLDAVADIAAELPHP